MTPDLALKGLDEFRGADAPAARYAAQSDDAALSGFPSLQFSTVLAQRFRRAEARHH
jgi:hypothetical protein